MTLEAIQLALSDITAEADPTLRHLKLASLASAIFRERGIELVVVGGSAIEFYTEGAYASGDIDLCLLSPTRLGAGLLGEMETDWSEVGRLAASPAYQNWDEVKALTDEQAKALKIRSPYDSDE